MSVKYQTVDFNLDTLTVTPSPLRLPVGYAHIIRLNITKDGQSGYELPVGSTVEMFFDDRNPVDDVDPIFSIDPIGFVWDAINGVYEAGFNASARPLNLVAVSTFVTLIKVSDVGANQVYQSTFHSLFRNVPLPAGYSCSTKNQLSQEFLDFWSQHFRWALIPDKPDVQELANFTNLNQVWTDVNLISEATQPGFYRTPDGNLFWKGSIGSDPDSITNQ